MIRPAKSSKVKSRSQEKIEKKNYISNWNISDKKGDYNALSDFYATYYFDKPSIKKQMKKLSKVSLWWDSDREEGKAKLGYPIDSAVAAELLPHAKKREQGNDILQSLSQKTEGESHRPFIFQVWKEKQLLFFWDAREK